MKPIFRILLTAAIILSAPLTAGAQQESVSGNDPGSLKAKLALATPGPLAMAAALPAPLLSVYAAPSFESAAIPARQYGYRRVDFELARAWLGTVVGFAYAYIGDLIIHYEDDFSKAHYLLNEDKNGDNVYNVLLYGGIPPYYAMRGVRSASIMKKDSLGSYLCGLVGSIGGLVYWTSLYEEGEDLNDDKKKLLMGFAVYSGLTAILADIGYYLF